MYLCDFDICSFIKWKPLFTAKYYKIKYFYFGNCDVNIFNFGPYTEKYIL